MTSTFLSNLGGILRLESLETETPAIWTVVGVSEEKRLVVGLTYPKPQLVTVSVSRVVTSMAGRPYLAARTASFPPLALLQDLSTGQ